MTNKFKVGNLIEWRGELGIVLEIGLDYPDNGNRRARFLVVHWETGEVMSYFKDYGCLYTMAEVIG